MYQHGKRGKSKKRQVLSWLSIVFVVVVLLVIAGIFTRNKLRPTTVIKQASPVVTHVNYDNKTKEYDEGDFMISLPVSWQPMPRPVGPYKSFTWQSSDRLSDGQVIVVYEDTIPANFAVNRVVIAEGENDHLNVDGSASDNCIKYTRTGIGTPNQFGAPAKWQGVDFLCDQANQQRDVLGTSSTDGINTVILRSQGTGASHKFFFTYTNYSINPDYTVFYNTLTSLRMQ